MTRLYYPHDSLGDVLLVLVDPEKKAAGSFTHGEVTMIIDEEGKPIGYNLFNFARKAKIKGNGMLVKPPKALLDIVGSEIRNAGFPVPVFEADSGYVVAKIVLLEEHPLFEKTSIVTLEGGEGSLMHTVSSLEGLEVGAKVVLLLPGYLGRNGEKFFSHVEKNIPLEALICSEKELGLGEGERKAYVGAAGEIGSDFFA